MFRWGLPHGSHHHRDLASSFRIYVPAVGETSFFSIGKWQERQKGIVILHASRKFHQAGVSLSCPAIRVQREHLQQMDRPLYRRRPSSSLRTFQVWEGASHTTSDLFFNRPAITGLSTPWACSYTDFTKVLNSIRTFCPSATKSHEAGSGSARTSSLHPDSEQALPPL